jgi:aspartyl-tRNA(Asn)/glutamyl-tRNA(Gln) amidotransferase subunit B
VLTSSLEMAEYFERGVAGLTKLVLSDPMFHGARPSGIAKAVANWVTGDISSRLNDDGVEISSSKVSSDDLARLIHRTFDNTLSNRAAKEVFGAMWAGEGDADTIIETRGLRQISDSGAIEALVDQVLAANAKLVDDYRAGKEKAFNALVGQVMKASQGKANPAQANAILKKKLG